MDDALRERVEALERAVTDGEHDLSAFAEEAAALERLDALESRVENIEDRVEELEAATQALRGYVGNVRSVNTDVEQRADAALARIESLESALAGAEAATERPVGDGSTGDGTPSEDRGDVTAPRRSKPETGMTVPGKSTPGGEGTSPEESTPGTDGTPIDRPGIGTNPDTASAGPGTAGRDGASGGSNPGAGGIDVRIDRSDDTTAARHGHTERTEQSGIPVSRGQSADDRSGGTAANGAAPTADLGTDRQADVGSSGAAGDRCRTCGRPHDTGTGPSNDRRQDTGPGSTVAPDVDGASEGTVTSNGDGAPGGDVVPDGDGDPFVGATEGGEAGESGTLQRIRELL